MAPETPPTVARIGFLAYVQDPGNGAGRGAILVTDEGTKPLEFRCTTPIRPNPLQRMLYGDTLRSYIAADLVGEPLLEAVQEKPSIVLVREPLFLKLHLKGDAEIVCVRRQGAKISEAITEDNGQSRSEPALLNCSTGRFQPLTVTGRSEQSNGFEEALEVLRRVFSNTDLLEPFDRIEKVVAELDRQESAGSDRARSQK